MDTREAPLKCPLDGVGEKSSGEAGAESQALSRDRQLGGRGGSCGSCAGPPTSHSLSLLVYTMKLSSRRLSGAQEILPDLEQGNDRDISGQECSGSGHGRDII